MRSPDYNKEFVLNFGVGGSGCLTVLGESPDFLFPPRSFSPIGLTEAGCLYRSGTPADVRCAKSSIPVYEMA